MVFTEKLAKFAVLEPAERKLVLQVLVLIPAVKLAMRVEGYGRTRDFISRFLPKSAESTLPEQHHGSVALRISRMVDITANHGPFKANCLERSLILWWLLARQGIHSDIIFGVQKTPDSPVQMHAWVNQGGQELPACAANDDYMVLS